jgi:hypothetical protein
MTRFLLKNTDQQYDKVSAEGHTDQQYDKDSAEGHTDQQ